MKNLAITTAPAVALALAVLLPVHETSADEPSPSPTADESADEAETPVAEESEADEVDPAEELFGESRLTPETVQSMAGWGPHLPLRHGSSWTYRITREGRAVEVLWEARRVDRSEFIGVIGRGARKPLRPEGLLEMTRGDAAPSWYIRFTDDGSIEIFETAFPPSGDVIRTDVAPTLRIPSDPEATPEWKGDRARREDGFVIGEESYTATAEKVTVPFGELDAVKIEVGARTIWLARGVGIVKMIDDDGTTTELTAATGTFFFGC